jgi:hypothetical protein
MRRLLLLCLGVLAGCSQLSSPPDPVEEGPSQVEEGLYTDDQIRALAPFDIDKESVAWEKNLGGLKNPLQIPCLAVVPDGETRSRGVVFSTLGLDDRRLRDFRFHTHGRVEFLRWQVSPSYDIVCMSGDRDIGRDQRQADDPTREVYGIRLVARSRDIWW